MEADWEVEIGPDAPVIEARWQGFLDLRQAQGEAGRISADVTFDTIRDAIAEARELPALAQALLLLNRNEEATIALSGEPQHGLARVYTSKCDVWATGGWDEDEMNAPSGHGAAGSACYLDLLPRHGDVFRDLAAAEAWARQAAGRLKHVVCASSRVDLVIRRALGPQDGLGVTAYVVGCGQDALESRDALSRALIAFAKTIAEG